jgi:hypothetical protein
LGTSIRADAVFFSVISRCCHLDYNSVENASNFGNAKQKGTYFMKPCVNIKFITELTPEIETRSIELAQRVAF